MILLSTLVISTPWWMMVHVVVVVVEAEVATIGVVVVS
jgi:hypothetical protein